MNKYYCLNCMELKIKYCGTDIKIGGNPEKTWPKGTNVPCALMKEK